VIGQAVRRGLAAGALAGLLAGVLGLVIGEPAIDEAIALEQAADAQEEPPGEISRSQQRVGLPLGTALVGVGVGAVFGVVAAAAAGRVAGDAWARSLKLGAVALYALVLLPLLKYPANPPAVGDPATVGARAGLYWGLVLVGLVLAAAAGALARQLAEAGWGRAARQTAAGLVLVVGTGALLAVLPSPGGEADVPAELLWSFRLRAAAVQAVLYGGTAVVFGLLASRAETAPAAAP
jgi:hypothetical protein